MIFVHYPRGARTGGPEALHQLVDSLRRQGAEAYLTPMPGTGGNARVSEYVRYEAPERSAFDSVDATIVVPEIAPGLASQFPNSRRIVWWLAAGVPKDNSTEHAAQSAHAYRVLISNGIQPFMLSDYIVVDDFPAGSSHRNRVVAYNGNKGAEFVRPVAFLMPNVEWLSLAGMTRQQIAQALRRAAIYLDLGHHPGKDRMPREAALSGAVVVTSRRGSAAEPDDVPIAEKVSHSSSVHIAQALGAILENLEAVQSGQQSYVEKIRREQEVFDDEVRRAFL